VDRSRPIRVSILDETISRSEALMNRRFVIVLLGSLAAAAALLALLGIYGVLAYAVSQRTREIGIRLALGAEAGRVIRSVLCRGILMTAAGLALGVIISVGIAGLLGNMLFGIEPTDPATPAAVALMMTAAAATAALLPAWRAARVEPATILRSE
jgi:ABC-type antimicrobial peptide transport system permease subunit